MDVVLNWLWQGGIVALAAAAILRLIPHSRTQARYCTVWAACAAVVVLPAMSLLGAAAVPAGEATRSSSASLVALPLRWWTSATTALGLWAIWAVGYAWRLGAAVVALRHAKRHARAFPADLETQLRHWMRMRATGRRARLVLSDGVRTAAVLSGRTPVIAVAPALVDSLSEADLDRVVVHEWAHVQRRDDLTQIGEMILCVVAGWHPAVWWLKRQLHLEREVACDEIAVSLTGSARAYAACLTRLAELPPGRVRPAPAPTAVSPSSVYSRVIRIVAPRSSAPTRASRAAPLAAALVVGTVALLVGRVHVVETVPAPRTVRDETLADRALAAEPHAAILPRLNDNARPVDLRTTGGSWPAPSGARDEEEDYTTTPAAASIDSAPEPVAADPPLPIEVVELPAIVALAPSSEAWMAEGAPAVEPQSPAIWSVAAQAGKAVGAGSEQTALATARFFTRFGKSVARSF